jgi:multidrug efflux pump subunit AcrA (membrane-fusion protein)
LQNRVAAWVRPQTEAREHAGHDHGPGSHHDHAGHDDANSLELSEQARKSIGLEVGKVTLGPYERTVSVPGIVAEQPGRTSIHVTSPFDGIVTKVERSRGEAVAPGEPLFELRLTDEDVVKAQAELLRTIEELDVLAREIKRIEPLADGGLPRKELLARQYEQQKLEGILRAQKQALLLHGASKEQVDQIVQSRMLLRTHSIAAPSSVPGDESSANVVYQIQQLNVEQGKGVTVGETLAVLANPAQLLIEGDAFESDIRQISAAAEQGRTVSAVLNGHAGRTEILRGLPFLHLDSKVDPQSRTFRFYVKLPNTVVRDSRQPGGARYVEWKFKPGQRLQVRVPVEVWKDRIVLPVKAVAQDGVETFVFQENGKHFDRRPVHVEHRDESFVVVANDGAIFPGDTIAMNGAQQLLIALKNKASGGIDPHAGHNH